MTKKKTYHSFIALAGVALFSLACCACSQVSEKSDTENTVTGNFASIGNELHYAIFEQQALAWIANASPQELIGQVLMLYVPGREPTERGRELLERVHPGGVILFEANIAGTPEGVRAFTDFLRTYGTIRGIAPFVAVDHEGGVVYRLKNNAVHIPAPLTYAESSGSAYAKTAGMIAGSELRALGFTLNLAPVAESSSAKQVLGTRIWSPVPEQAGQFASLYIKRHQLQGTACALKHFPGTGATDPHRGLSVLTDESETFSRLYLAPFNQALRAEPAAVLLSLVIAPVLDPHEPLVFSHKAVTEFLKQKLAFRGFVLTDDLYMKALAGYGSIAERCLKALNAGCDMLMLSGSDVHDVIVFLLRALEEGRLDRKRLEDAVTRIIIQKLCFKIGDIAPFSLEAYTKLLAEHMALLNEVPESSKR